MNHLKTSKKSHPLTSYQPKTKLGAVALNLAAATTSSYLTIMSTAGYVYAVTQLQLPNPTFGTPPNGVNINPATLQTAWTTFNTDFDIIQGQLDNFMDTRPGTSNPTSILAQLVSVPQSIQGINGNVVLDFASKNASGLETLFNALNSNVTSLKTSLTTLGTNINNATSTLNTAATTGVLEQLYNAYESDIQGLQQAVAQAQSTISSDNKKIIGEGVGAGVSITVGIVGLANFWNPVGWILMAGGAIGAYFAIEEINFLKAQIEGLKQTIQTDTDWETTYSQSATAIQAVIGSINGFASMQSAAEKELTALENVLATLSTDIVDAVSDLEESTPDWNAAQTEWNEIMATANSLANITAYVWPGPQELSNPTGFTSSGSGLYQVSSSGAAYYLANGGTTWSALADKCLSIVTGAASGAKVVGINGAPAVGAAGTDPDYTTNYYVRTYDLSSNTWTNISTFPAAQVATDGTDIYAIDQTISSRRVYKYNGSGTDWTTLPALPNSDAASSIAVAGSKVFALTLNSQEIYYYNGTSWVSLQNMKSPYISLSGNGNYLGVVTSDNYSYLWNASTNTFENIINEAITSTGSSVATLAQMSNGDQLIINTSQELYSIDNSISPPSSTLLEEDVVGITAVGGVFRVDGDGNAYSWTDETINTWTKLPAITTS
ncbi:MAG: hypothetical protein AAGA77_23975 [Bacteroidota bacterium]